MFKISIIIACYNSENKLSITLESIITQDMSYIQIIIVDGGSSDNSKQIFNKYKNYINILISENDNGIAHAWNKGLKYVKGEFVNFLNAGDYYDKNMLNGVYLNCLNYKTDFIGFGDTTLFDYKSTYFRRGKYYKKNIFLVNGFGFMHPTVFFPSQLISKVGYFNEHKRIAMDTDWLLKCLKKNIPFYNIGSHVFMEKGGLSYKHKYAAMGEYLDSLYTLQFPVHYIPLFFFVRFLGSLKLLFRIIFERCFILLKLYF